MSFEEQEEVQYIGFWSRVFATIVDTILLSIILIPILLYVYADQNWQSKASIVGPLYSLLSWVIPAVVIILFWKFKAATPGKITIGAKIVDARTGEYPSTGQFVDRYFAYFVSALPLCLGVLWVAFDKRKQGWHDKLAGTVVILDDGGK